MNESTVERQSQINLFLSTLEKQATSCRSRVEKLYTRLVPLLRPNLPEPDNHKDKKIIKEPLAPLVSHLDEIIGHIDVINKILDDINIRLEI